MSEEHERTHNAIVELPRGGMVVTTSRGPVQFGVPPETIKDSLLRPFGVPSLYVLTRDFFSYERGVSFAEMEFPIYFNFFVRKQRVKVVGTAEQRDRLLAFMQESMFGPEHLDLSREVVGDPPWLPDLRKELNAFRVNPFAPERMMTLDDVLEFHLFEEDTPEVLLEGLKITRRSDGGFLLSDPDGERVIVPGSLSLPPRSPAPKPQETPFETPQFGVTILGSGHGFDPRTKTTGFVLWLQGRGILVDPPVDTTEWLRERDVPTRCIDAIILTHVHGDHDAGTLQKALQADRVRLYSSLTVFESFLRKSKAITGLAPERFGAILDFRPVPIGRDITINGARFRFFYALHSIPTIGFEVWHGGQSMVYSADTLFDPTRIRAFHDQGVLSEGRTQALIDFPFDKHDLIIHEAGIPPLHTPVEVLATLPEAVKEKLFLVHTTADKIAPETGLTLAPTGLEGTLSLNVDVPAQSRVTRWLMAMSNVDHFREMPPAKAIEFLDIVEEQRFSKGDIVIEKGTPGETFYMILSGKAAVFAGEVARKVFVMFDYFGEASLLRDTPRSADVIALTELTVLAISKANFLAFIEGSTVHDRMMRLFANRDHHTWVLMDKNPVLRDLNTAQRNELQSFMEYRLLEAGEIIAQPNTEGRCPGVLVASGIIEKSEEFCEPIAYGPGELSAEVEVIVHQLPVNFTLRATSPSHVFLLPTRDFAAFLASFPGLYLRLLHVED